VPSILVILSLAERVTVQGKMAEARRRVYWTMVWVVFFVRTALENFGKNTFPAAGIPSAAEAGMEAERSSQR
jgi:hypothetical protein